MENGVDGRFYDSHFDFNNDGFLNGSELVTYREEVFGEQSYSSGNRRPYQNRNPHPQNILDAALYLILELVMVTLFVLGGILLIGCPPIGALMLYGGLALNDRLN